MKHYPIFSPEIKPIVKQKILRVFYRPPRGMAVYITGPGNFLGNWKIATKLKRVNPGEWHFTQYKIHSGMHFKILIYINNNGANKIPIKSKLAIWENPQGVGGIKEMYFYKREMKHYPKFNLPIKLPAINDSRQ